MKSEVQVMVLLKGLQVLSNFQSDPNFLDQYTSVDELNIKKFIKNSTTFH